MCEDSIMARQQPIQYQKITVDQVAWIKQALSRFKNEVNLSDSYPSISRYSDTMFIATVLELMEILNLKFASKGAALNLISQIEEFDIIEPRTIMGES